MKLLKRIGSVSALMLMAGCDGGNSSVYLNDPDVKGDPASIYGQCQNVSYAFTRLGCGGTVDPDYVPPPSSPVLIENVPFADPDLRQCLLDTVAQHNSMYPPDQQITRSDQVTELYCGWGGEGYRYYDIDRLKGIQYLINLDYLSVGARMDSFRKLSLTPLASLTKLSGLWVSGPRIQDFSPLSSSRTLRWISMDHTEINSLEPLVTTPLESISITESPKPAYLEPLSRISTFAYASVMLDGDELYQSKLNEVLRLPNLRSLNIFSNGYAWAGSIIGIENATQLEYLVIGSDVPIVPSHLSNLVNLKGLTFDYWNSIRGTGDISALASLTQLESLTIPNASIQDISVLSGLVHLKWLGLSQNQIQNVTPLNNLAELESLSLSENQISDISGFGNLTKLSGLFLDGNQVTSIASLLHLSNLTYLDVYGSAAIPCTQISQMEAHLVGIANSYFRHSDQCSP